MTVKKFVERITEINNLIPYMPLPEENAVEDDRIALEIRKKIHEMTLVRLTSR